MTSLPLVERTRLIVALVCCLYLPASALPARAQSGEENSSLTPRLRLFRIAPGFLNDPVWLQEDDSMAAILGVPDMVGSMQSGPTAKGLDWIQFGAGTDNPYFDLRRPGDPGGYGYFRMNTQMQLLDSARTSCTLGLQAVTPAGIQFAGVPEGPTVVSPAFSVFHALTEQTAIQGFVTKNVAISDTGGTGLLMRNVQYGMAVQRPLAANGPEGLRSLFLSVGALGQVQPDRDSFKLLPTCDVLPGLYWHVNENWWMSSGLLFPVGPSHTAPSQWQLTCSFQF